MKTYNPVSLVDRAFAEGAAMVNGDDSRGYHFEIYVGQWKFGPCYCDKDDANGVLIIDAEGDSPTFVRQRDITAITVHMV